MTRAFDAYKHVLGNSGFLEKVISNLQTRYLYRLVQFAETGPVHYVVRSRSRYVIHFFDVIIYMQSKRKYQAAQRTLFSPHMLDLDATVITTVGTVTVRRVTVTRVRVETAVVRITGRGTLDTVG